MDTYKSMYLCSWAPGPKVWSSEIMTLSMKFTFECNTVEIQIKLISKNLIAFFLLNFHNIHSLKISYIPKTQTNYSHHPSSLILIPFLLCSNSSIHFFFYISFFVGGPNEFNQDPQCDNGCGAIHWRLLSYLLGE